MNRMLSNLNKSLNTPHRFLFLLLALSTLLALVPSRAAQAQTEETAAPETLIAAFYYPWYGNPTNNGTWVHWEQNYHQPSQDIGSDFYPTLGAYSSTDDAILSQHMLWLKQASINVIVVSWWGRDSFEDRALPKVLEHAAQHGIRVAFHIEPYLTRSATQLVSDIEYLYERYGSSPAFFRTTLGSPYNNTDKTVAAKNSGLFFLWMPGIAGGAGPGVGPAYWQNALDQIHNLPDGGIVIVQSTEPTWIITGHFDGAYDYTNMHTQLQSWGNQLPKNAWFVPSVMPGFSANRVGYPAEVNRAREAGAFYDRQWEAVLNLGIRPTMIGVTSFNEWHEGTQIEPAVSNFTDGKQYTYLAYDEKGQDYYLQATAAWVARLRQSKNYTCALNVAVDFTHGKVADGLYQNDLDDGPTRAESIGGSPARRAIKSVYSNVRYMYLWIHREFLHAQAAAVIVTIEYYDLGTGYFHMDYDSTDVNATLGGAYKSTAPIKLTNTKQWRTATFTLPDTFFGDRGNNGSDFRIAATNTDLLVRRVDVKRTAPCNSGASTPPNATFIPFAVRP